MARPIRRPPQAHCLQPAVFTAFLLLFVIIERPISACLPAPPSPSHLDTSQGVSPSKKDVVSELDWSDIPKLLQDRLVPEHFDSTLSDLSLRSHETASQGDELLANKVIEAFENNNMNPWKDEHFVKVQILPSDSSNKVLFGKELIGEMRGYLSYSATGNRQGRVVYTHYGKKDDFQYVTDMKIDLTGAVVLLRAGKISFAEKVANAAKMKAAAVLIYPDPADYSFLTNTELYGHVHLGSGDPYTPGFPSFTHTQLPPVKSSGLPEILAQTITANMAAQIFQKMGGVRAPSSWSEGYLPGVLAYNLGDKSNIVTVEVNNVLVERHIHNVFGVIKGFVDSDRYVLIGAQRDSWGPGYAKSTVGTSILLELARAISDMVKNDDFRPRRSIAFVSWSAGEYGTAGTTEWLEEYIAQRQLMVFSYISLDGVLTGQQTFKAAASPLLYSLVQDTMKEMKSPIGPKPGEMSLYQQVAGIDWEKAVMVDMQMEDSAYPFMAFSGIPSVSFCFTDQRGSGEYPFFGTMLDTKQRLDYATAQRTAQLAASAAQFAGQVALRLVHDHLLRLDLERYVLLLRALVNQINRRVYQLEQAGVVSGKDMEVLQWLMSAVASFARASAGLALDIQDCDLSDVEMCRMLNDRIMRVESDLLSSFVSVKDAPFRHILFGSGSHTIQALVDHLNAIRERLLDSDTWLIQNHFAEAAWTIQSCANNLVGDVWAVKNANKIRNGLHP